MGNYGTSRAIEASIINYIESALASNWSSVEVEKTFARVYTLPLPVVCVRIAPTDYDKLEIGSETLVRTSTVLIDIFGTSMGFTLDLKDFLVSTLKSGMIYYDYEIHGAGVTSATDSGYRIRVLNISDEPIDADQDRDKVEVHDRFRWLITLSITLGKVE